MTDDPVGRLHRDLGLKRLNPWWAKLEIVLGLAAVAAGLFGGVRTAVDPSGHLAPLLPFGALFVLGGYLSLAGHRSHLYQSNNRLAAHLADLIRTPRDPS